MSKTTISALMLATLAAMSADADPRVARNTADIGPKHSYSVGVFAPLTIALTDRLELQAHPLVFFVAPHMTARFALIQSSIRLTGEATLSVPTFAMRLTKGFLFPTWANSANQIPFMVVPRLGAVLSGGARTERVWSASADFAMRVPFGVVNAGPLDSFLAPLDLLFAAPLTGYVGRVGGAYDVPFGQFLRARLEANVHVTGASNRLVVGQQDVGPLANLSPWFFTAHLALDISVGKSSRLSVGAWYGNYDQGASVVVPIGNGISDRVRVRSNNILPTIDFIWAG
jgi:hypothetical protein